MEDLEGMLPNADPAAPHRMRTSRRPCRTVQVSWVFAATGSLAYEGPWLDFLRVFGCTPGLEQHRKQYSSQRECRALLIRCLGVVYAFAFLCIAFQGRVLIGDQGLTPVACDPEDCPITAMLGLDRTLELLGWTGVVCGALQMLGLDSVFLSLALYAMYLSFYQLARRADGFFHYGWVLRSALVVGSGISMICVV